MTRFLALIIVLIAAGCASRPVTPVMIDCNRLGMTPVTNADQRLDFHGFSILPPKGEHWCIFNRDSHLIAFGKNLFGGKLWRKPPRPAERAHSFVAVAAAVEVKDAKVESFAELQAFVERWLRRGGVMRRVGSKWVLDSTPLNPRFTLVESKVVIDRSLGADCVRTDVVIEERDNPRVPQFVLVLKEPHNFLCLHPYSMGLLIFISYSERYVRGAEPRPLLADALKHEVEPFLRSVVFTQVR